jgi:putative FmdB family regulatory protein
MPIYEYRCQKGHTFDTMQRFSDDAIDTCEVCGGPASRVFRAPAVHFKGSGFYNTDYGTRKRSRENEAHKQSSKASESSKSSDSKSDSKPASSDSKPKAKAEG